MKNVRTPGRPPGGNPTRLLLVGRTVGSHESKNHLLYVEAEVKLPSRDRCAELTLLVAEGDTQLNQLQTVCILSHEQVLNFSQMGLRDIPESRHRRHLRETPCPIFLNHYNSYTESRHEELTMAMKLYCWAASANFVSSS